MRTLTKENASIGDKLLSFACGIKLPTTLEAEFESTARHLDDLASCEGNIPIFSGYKWHPDAPEMKFPLILGQTLEQIQEAEDGKLAGTLYFPTFFVNERYSSASKWTVKGTISPIHIVFSLDKYLTPIAGAPFAFAKKMSKIISDPETEQKAQQSEHREEYIGTLLEDHVKGYLNGYQGKTYDHYYNAGKVIKQREFILQRLR